MNINVYMISIAFVLLGTGLPAATRAQTPLPKAPPDLTIKWLDTLAVSPASATAGTRFTGTVKLARRAVGDLRVSLGLDGAKAVEGAGFVLDGVIVPQFLVVPNGRDQAAFTITSSGSATWTGSRAFTVRAYYASEKLSAGFTVIRLANR